MCKFQIIIGEIKSGSIDPLFMAYGYILVLLPPAYHGENFAVADRDWNSGYRIFLDEDAVGFVAPAAHPAS